MRVLASVLAFALAACTTAKPAPVQAKAVAPVSIEHYSKPADVRADVFTDYIRKKNPRVSERMAKKLAVGVIKYAAEFALDPYMYLGLVETESTFDCSVVSPKQARGCSQVIAKWHPDTMRDANARFGSTDVARLDVGLYAGARIMREYIDSSTDLNHALSKYNGSTKDKRRVFARTVLTKKKEVVAYHQEVVAEKTFRYYASL